MIVTNEKSVALMGLMIRVGAGEVDSLALLAKLAVAAPEAVLLAAGVTTETDELLDKLLSYGLLVLAVKIRRRETGENLRDAKGWCDRRVVKRASDWDEVSSIGIRDSLKAHVRVKYGF